VQVPEGHYKCQLAIHSGHHQGSLSALPEIDKKRLLLARVFKAFRHQIDKKAPDFNDLLSTATRFGLADTLSKREGHYQLYGEGHNHSVS
jgi:hypothetical protein